MAFLARVNFWIKTIILTLSFSMICLSAQAMPKAKKGKRNNPPPKTPEEFLENEEDVAPTEQKMENLSNKPVKLIDWARARAAVEVECRNKGIEPPKFKPFEGSLPKDLIPQAEIDRYGRFSQGLRHMIIDRKSNEILSFQEKLEYWRLLQTTDDQKYPLPAKFDPTELPQEEPDICPVRKWMDKGVPEKDIPKQLETYEDALEYDRPAYEDYLKQYSMECDNDTIYPLPGCSQATLPADIWLTGHESYSWKNKGNAYFTTATSKDGTELLIRVVYNPFFISPDFSDVIQTRVSVYAHSDERRRRTQYKGRDLYFDFETRHALGNTRSNRVPKLTALPKEKQEAINKLAPNKKNRSRIVSELLSLCKRSDIYDIDQYHERFHSRYTYSYNTKDDCYFFRNFDYEALEHKKQTRQITPRQFSMEDFIDAINTILHGRNLQEEHRILLDNRLDNKFGTQDD